MSDMIVPSNALDERRIALSVSESPDLARLGLTDTHLRLALGEIARAVVTGGGRLAYGGHLHPEGYTTFLVSELERHYRREDLISLYIAWPVHRAMSVEHLRETMNELPIAARAIYLDLDGEPIDPFSDRDVESEPVSPDDAARGLTAMRRNTTAQSNARVLIGGKRQGYTGKLPGLVEEALFAVEAGQPLYLAAGFGGATLDIARALGLDVAWSRPIEEQERDLWMIEGLGQLATLAAGRGWHIPPNGLSEGENRRLTSSFRPGEIAALISLGVGRLSSRNSGTA